MAPVDTQKPEDPPRSAPEAHEAGDSMPYMIYDSFLDAASLEEAVAAGVSPVPWADRDTVPAEVRVLLCLGDEQIRDLESLAMERRWIVGLLPNENAPNATAAMGVKGSLAALFDHYAATEPLEADIMTCNGELVFSSVVIGRVLSLRPYDINRPQTRWSFFKGALRGMGKLRMKPYRLVTAKERKIQLAAIGLICLSHTQSTLLGRNFTDELGPSDGRLAMLALAPRSILDYLWFMLRLMLPNKISLSKLPGSVALIQSNRIHLEAPHGCEYLVDGKPVHGEEIEFRVLEQRLKLLPGPNLRPSGVEPSSSEKERVRLNHVPVDDAALAMQDKTLPLFSHATESEYRDLFTSLRGSALASSSYQVLMVLSVLLALTGLYANSAPVIIGAMILAPLMAPVVSLAMGLARSETALIQSSLRSLGIGIVLGLGCSVLLALAMPLDIPTQEMRARMSPTLLDLLVAIVSGVAGAYAHAKEEVAKSLAGVAIAVALVPPLAVTGIGLGWADWGMAWGAGLLLLTNLVGIALAASVTFLMLGFAPFKRARAGMWVTLGLMLVISIPLSIAFNHLVQRGNIVEEVPQGALELAGVPVQISQVRVNVGEPHLVKLVISAPQYLDYSHLDELKTLITRRVGEPVELEAQINLRR